MGICRHTQRFRILFFHRYIKNIFFTTHHLISSIRKRRKSQKPLRLTSRQLSKLTNSSYKTLLQQDNTFDVSSKLKHIPTKLRKCRQYLYSTNTARASPFPQNISFFNFTASFYIQIFNFV